VKYCAVELTDAITLNGPSGKKERRTFCPITLELGECRHTS
jgi:hypothetical protein